MMRQRRGRRLSVRAREELHFKQAMGLALMAADVVLVMGKGQEAQRQVRHGKSRPADLRRLPEKKWVGLAWRLEDRLRELGLDVPKEDAWLHGGLNVLDYRCRVLSAFIEGLAEWPARPQEWEQLGNVVARMWAMVHTMRESLGDLEPVLQRLLISICKVRSPGRHLRKAARSRRGKA